MKLDVYSLQKVLFRGEAVSVNCQTASGEITVLDHHRPLISVLKKGNLKITRAESDRSIDKSEKEVYIPVSSGFLEVRDGNEARFLVEEE
ncbi:MAG: hypothetical protein Q8P49_04360 [Candidatus Liptonbacteria bacterium]|nr:hypothetical protein [Candidatus Liptonbacteria bacterium]